MRLVSVESRSADFPPGARRLLRLYIGGCDRARCTGAEHRDAASIDAMREPGRVDRRLRRRPYCRGGRHRGLHGARLQWPKGGRRYSAIGKAPDTDRILTLEVHKASLGPAGNRRSTFETKANRSANGRRKRDAPVRNFTMMGRRRGDQKLSSISFGSVSEYRRASV